MADNDLLGQKIRYTRELVRVRKTGGRREWEERAAVMPGLAAHLGIEGVIVGERTVSDGFAEGGYDEPRTYSATAHRNVWLVAYDMRRKHVLVPKESVINRKAFS